MSTADLLTLLLGGGMVATLGALFKGLQALQSGARARERDTVASLVEQRNEAWDDRDFLADDRDYWQSWAGSVEFLARSNGVNIPDRPARPVRAKQRDKEATS